MRRASTLGDENRSHVVLDPIFENKKRQCEIRIRIAGSSEHPIGSNGEPLLFVDDTSECPVCKESFETVAIYKCGHFLCNGCHDRLLHGDFPYITDPNHCIVCKEDTPFGDVVIHTLSAGRHKANASFAANMDGASKFKHPSESSHTRSVLDHGSCTPQPVVLFGKLQHADDSLQSALILDIAAPQSDTKSNNHPVFVYLFDVSGSMNALIRRLREHGTFRRLITKLVGCYLSFSVFSEDVRTIIHSVLVRADNVESLIDTLHNEVVAGGGTALHTGLKHLTEHMVPEMMGLLGQNDAHVEDICVMIVTDGADNSPEEAAEEMVKLEQTCFPFLLGAGDDYSFDTCDKIVRRDTTKYMHVEDESTLVDHMVKPPNIRRFKIKSTCEDSSMYYNGNITRPVNGVHEWVVQLHGECNEHSRIVLTNVDETSLTHGPVQVGATCEPQLAFALTPIMQTTIAISHIKDLSFNVSKHDMYANIHELWHAKRVIRTYGVGMGSSYDDLNHMIDTQIKMFTELISQRNGSGRDSGIGRCHSSNTTASLATSTALRAYSVPC
jgi:hypothetical protein